MKQIKFNNISTSYYITPNGRCYNTITGKYLKGQVGKNGYLSYNLTLPNGRKKRFYAHRLVALNYLSGSTKPYINHIDGNKLNNYVDNLEWCTAKENQQHALENELRKYNHIFCFNKDQRLVAEYLNIADAAKAVNVSRAIISQEINKEEKTLVAGFYWSKSKSLGKIKEYKNFGKAKEVFQYDLNGRFINSYESTGIAARSLGLKTGSHIGECCRGKIKNYKGFIWRYSEDIVLSLDESQRNTPQE